VKIKKKNNFSGGQGIQIRKNWSKGFHRGKNASRKEGDKYNGSFWIINRGNKATVEGGGDKNADIKKKKQDHGLVFKRESVQGKQPGAGTGMLPARRLGHSKASTKEGNPPYLKRQRVIPGIIEWMQAGAKKDSKRKKERGGEDCGLWSTRNVVFGGGNFPFPGKRRVRRQKAVWAGQTTRKEKTKSGPDGIY